MKIIAILLLAFATLVLASPFPGIGYNKKKTPVGPKPTWRPWTGSRHAENQLMTGNKDEPAGAFQDDYYDDYDSAVEGSRRNMLIYHTFEERMKSYVKVMILQQQNQKSAQAMLKAAENAAGKVKANKEKSTSSSSTKRSKYGRSRSFDIDSLGGGLLG